MVLTIVSTFVGFALAHFVSPSLSPVSDLISQGVNYAMPVRPADTGIAITLYRTKEVNKKQYHNWMRRAGYDNTVADAMARSQYTFPQVSQLIIAKWRGHINDESYYEQAKKIGIQSKELDLIEKTMRFHPGAQDLVRFGVREAYKDNIAKLYGYDEDYPEEITDDLAKAGMDPEWMKKYWRSHWELPSVQQGYQMLHRGKIDEEGLDTLLKIKDIPSGWRKPIMEISYSPFTRVDLRRLYKTGIINKDQMLTGYKDIGYDDIKAQQLTDFGVAYALEEPKVIAETKVKQAYFEGKIDKITAAKMLQDFGYTDEDRDFVISLWDDDINEIELQDSIKNIEAEFLYGGMTESIMTTQITSLGLPTAGKQKIIVGLTNAKLRQKQLPSKSDIIKWYNGKLIDINQYKSLMKDIGYSDYFIDLYIKEIDQPGSSEYRVPTRADYKAFYNNKSIDTQGWINGMFALGYSPNDIELYANLYDIDLSEFQNV